MMSESILSQNGHVGEFPASHNSQKPKLSDGKSRRSVKELMERSHVFSSRGHDIQCQQRITDFQSSIMKITIRLVQGDTVSEPRVYKQNPKKRGDFNFEEKWRSSCLTTFTA